jgi:hypothetical protein
MQKFANLEAMAIMAHLQSSIRSIIYQLRWCFFTVFFRCSVTNCQRFFIFLLLQALQALRMFASLG